MDAYRIAGIDVHKKMLAVVVGSVSRDGITFERSRFANHEADIAALRQWLREMSVTEVVMESTAQYWKTLWRELEQEFRLFLAQPMSNRAPRGRKTDYRDAERLVRRHVAGELTMSFVPPREQRFWRRLAREKEHTTRSRVREVTALEAFLEDTHIKLSTVVTDITGVSGWRILKAIAEGATDPAQLAAHADPGVKARPEQIAIALGGARTMAAAERALLRHFLARIDLLSAQIEHTRHLLAEAEKEHQNAILRLTRICGVGVDAAHVLVAEIGPTASSFDTAGALAGWIGVCPGKQESAGVSASDRSPKGNRRLRSLMAQCANAAVNSKASVFQIFYQSKVARLGHGKTIWAVAHKLTRIIWKVLHEGAEYEERGPRVASTLQARRMARVRRDLRALGMDPDVILRMFTSDPGPNPKLATT